MELTGKVCGTARRSLVSVQVIGWCWCLISLLSGVARGGPGAPILISVGKKWAVGIFNAGRRQASAREQSLGFDFSNNLTPKYCNERSKNKAKFISPTAFKGAKTPKLPGALPLDSTRGPKAGPWTPPFIRSAHFVRYVLFVSNFVSSWIIWPPTMEFLVTPHCLYCCPNHVVILHKNSVPGLVFWKCLLCIKRYIVWCTYVHYLLKVCIMLMNLDVL